MCKKIRTWQHDLGSASCRNMLIGGPAAEARGSLAWHAQKRHGQRRPEQEVCCYIVVSISKPLRHSFIRLLPHWLGTHAPKDDVEILLCYPQYQRESLTPSPRDRPVGRAAPGARVLAGTYIPVSCTGACPSVIHLRYVNAAK